MSITYEEANRKSEQEPSDMDRLRAAIKEGKRIEIQYHVGAASATFSVARENGISAAEANARGERVARIMNAQGECDFECGVNFNEARELLDSGAVEA